MAVHKRIDILKIRCIGDYELGGLPACDSVQKDWEGVTCGWCRLGYWWDRFENWVRKVSSQEGDT